MKQTGWILLSFFVLLLIFNLFLVIFPLKKNVFYTNDERVEEFVYNKQSYPIVMVGSSLSGAFEGKRIFDKPFFNMYLPYTGACTGVEVILRSGKIPRQLFIETNHAERGIDPVLINNIFDEPLYTLRYYLPFLLKKNRLLPNIIDRIKSPQSNRINSQRPPASLYAALITKTRKEWTNIPEDFNNKQFTRLKESLQFLSSQGCEIIFYEMPMDSSLNKSTLLSYERNLFLKLSAEKGYKFIKTDTSRSYNTGDGVHLLTDDANIYLKYFLSNYKRL